MWACRGQSVENLLAERPCARQFAGVYTSATPIPAPASARFSPTAHPSIVPNNARGAPQPCRFVQRCPYVRT